MRRLGFKPKKSLGQHFLIDHKVLSRIIVAAGLDSEDWVIEVGPGLGILTRELAKKAKRVIAVELDTRLVSSLPQTLADFPNVSIVNADILQTDPAELLASYGNREIPSYKVVANLPYYITSPTLRHFLEARHKPTLMVVMVQKEVGEAIVAKPGEMSLLALSVQFYSQPTIVDFVPARSFYPPPKVDSVILRLELYKEPPVKVAEAKFFKLARAGFCAPRKQLHNALAKGLGMPPSEVVALLKKVGIDPKRRAETLELGEWAKLCEVVTNYM